MKNITVNARRFALALVLLTLALPGTAWAKGRTTRVVFTGMGLARPTEITSGAALDMQNGPWGGGFLDQASRAVTVGPARRVCQVDFYVEYDRNNEQLAYVLYYYYPASDGTRGYIYLPGRGEPWYPMNTGTILRPGLDGTWRAASQRWEDAVAHPALGLRSPARHHSSEPGRGRGGRVDT